MLGVGTLCLGQVVGYITYRTLAKTTEKAAVSDLATVIGAIGGIIITGLFGPPTAWRCVGRPSQERPRRGRP